MQDDVSYVQKVPVYAVQ